MKHTLTICRAKKRAYQYLKFASKKIIHSCRKPCLQSNFLEAMTKNRKWVSVVVRILFIHYKNVDQNGFSSLEGF